MIPEIQLKNEYLDVGLLPERGASLSYLRFDGRDVMRAWSEARRHRQSYSILDDSACFPLLPFSNRIKSGCFKFKDKEIVLPVNWSGDDNAIHGDGWQKSWEIADQTPTSCTLNLKSDGSWWPWRYDALYSFVLDGQSLTMQLSVTNKEDCPMPCGLGFHPYFLKNDKTKLQFEADCAYLPFSQTDVVRFKDDHDSRLNFNELSGFSNQLVDHNYDSVGEEARITNAIDGVDVIIRSDSGATNSVVYVPVGESFFCFEPTTHPAGAFNSDDLEDNGVVVLQSNQTHSLTTRIELSAHR